MKAFYRMIAVFLSSICCISLATVFSSALTDQSQPDAEYPEVFQQFDTRWSGKEDLGSSGCGLLSLVNAVNYLTGNFIDPVELAVYAHKIDAYNGSVGGGTARWVLYRQLQDYEKKYGFKVTVTGKDAGVDNKDFVNNLKKGCVAVCHVYGHFIAIVDYNAKDKTYLVYDSAANPDRRNTTASPTWLTKKYLTESEFCKVGWWCLISRTETSENTVDGRTYTNQAVPATIRTEARSTVTLTGSTKASRALNGLGYVIDYNYQNAHKVTETFQADANEKKDFSVDVKLTGLTEGLHTIRLYATTDDGGYSDIAVYSVFIHDGDVTVDENTGDLTIGMSGCMGQTDVVKKMAVTKANCPIFRADGGDVLFLGDIDLSKYTSCVVEYSTRATFDMDKCGVIGLIGLKSVPVSYGSEGAAYNMTGSLATVEMTEADRDGGGFAQFREAVIDLTDINTRTSVYLSLYNPSKDQIAVKSVTFRTGFESTTEAPTEVLTEEITEIESGIGTDSPESSVQESDTAQIDVKCCRSVLSFSSLTLLICGAYVLMRKHSL